ncbi:hypothetical protein BMS81_04260 [Leuconostoc pseudomesenteroides]|nr:hypothetical protein BMS81_04260 [Leuconostoc pseudomesenteroides]
MGYLARNQAQAHLPTHPKLPTIAFNRSEYARLGGKDFYSVERSVLEQTKATNVIVPYRLPEFGDETW